MCRIFIILLIGQYLCPVFNMCCAYFELSLLYFMSWMCSLCRVLNVLPVWPTYFILHVSHFSWYTPLVLYISVIGFFDFRWCWSVLVVLYAIFKWVFRNSLVRILVSGPTYVKVAHFVFCIVFSCVGVACVFCFHCLLLVSVINEY
jgi:hypothetical protein